MSEVLGWNIEPRTWLRDGQFGEGMVKLWQETKPAQTAVDLVPADNAGGLLDRGPFKARMKTDELSPHRRRHSGAAADGRIRCLVNNADRKGNHTLAMGDGHRYGVDHGLTFHSEYKPRIVPERVGCAEELQGIDRVLEDCRVSWAPNWGSCLPQKKLLRLLHAAPVALDGAVSGSER